MVLDDWPLDAFDLAPETVEARFRWAERRGNARWIWPDIAKDQWSAALDGIEASLRAALTGASNAPTLSGDPDAFGVAAYTSGTGPLLGHWLEGGTVAASPSIAAVLAYQLRHNRLRMRLLMERAKDLVAALTEAGCAPVVIKGMHTALRYFPEAGARPLSDIDLVIAPATLPGAEAVLAGLGYRGGAAMAGPPRQRAWRPPTAPMMPRTLAFVHHDDPWTVDLQESFDRSFASGSRVVELDREIAAAALDPWPLDAGARVLPQPWLLLYLAVHASNGFENLTLLRLTELALVAREDAARGALDWATFTDAADRIDAAGLIYPALHLTEQLAPGTVPDGACAHARAATSAAARRFVESLTPASAHKVVRQSREDKFLSSPTLRGKVAQLLAEIVPQEAGTLGGLARIYQRRAWKLARGTMLR